MHVAKSNSEGTVGPETNLGASADTLKRQLFALLEKAGINNPGGMTRIELKNALRNIGIADEVQSELTVVLDSLDKILYSPIREKEARTPAGIAEKINALSKEIKPAGNARQKK